MSDATPPREWRFCVEDMVAFCDKVLVYTRGLDRSTLPEVPTVAEQGYPNFEMTQWYGLLAPATLPQAAIDKLALEAAKAIKSPAAVTRLSEDTAQAAGGTPAEFAAFIAAERKRRQPVIARAKIKPD